MKSLEDLSLTTAALIPLQRNKDVGRFLRYCINAGKVDPNKYGQFKETLSQSVKQIDRKWTWTRWRICTESEIENALVEKAWEFLTSRDCLLAHLISIVATWNLFVNHGKNKKGRISVDNILRHINFIDITDVCESCRTILRMKETTHQKTSSCPPLEQVMFACILINNSLSSREDNVLLIKQYIIPAKLHSSEKFFMAAICRSLPVLDYLWAHDDGKELRGLCDDLALYLIPNLGLEDLDLIRWLCDRVVDVKSKYNGGATLMHVAAKVGNVELFEQLLSKGADVNAVNNDGKSPLHKAAEAGNVNVVNFLLDKGADIGIQNQAGSTVLHKAAENDQTQVIKTLLDRGASIESVNLDGDTPLQVAAKMGKTKAIDVLLKRGAKIEVENKVGHTPLLTAIKFYQINSFEMLIDRGAKIKHNIAQISIEACKHNPELVLPLLDRKVSEVTTENDSGETFLHDLAKKGNVILIRKLIDRGAAADKPNDTGETPLYFACN